MLKGSISFLKKENCGESVLLILNSNFNFHSWKQWCLEPYIGIL